jgi:cyclopropane-fatty-acyl-phospholipid synthase
MATTTTEHPLTENGATPNGSDARRITLEILDRVFGGAVPENVACRLWDGTRWPANAPDTVDATVVLNHPGTLRRMFLPPTERAIGEAYVRGDFDIEGDLEAALNLNDVLFATPRSPAAMVGLLQLVRQLPEIEAHPVDGRGAARLRGILHSRQRDREAIRFHYDVSNDFYALWLDKRMTYSCAYFQTGTEDLDTAQVAKYDLICRKLRLQPGERLLDIGCGWGGLAIHAAERYGVEATGVTLSEQQAKLARERAAASGLGERVRILLSDYRDLPSGMPYDKIVSVGMFEHVGRPRLPEYFSVAHRLLKAGGLFLNHGIAAQHDFLAPPMRLVDRAAKRQTSFIWNYVFPDGELVPISEALGYAERAGWEVRDVESLREHYARTLRHWVRRLEAHADEAKRIAGEQAYRVWRIYMSGAAYSFTRERISVYQSLLAKPDAAGNAHLPPTRADIYRED